MSTKPKRLFGRRKILSDYKYVDETNVIEVLNDAYATHVINRAEIKYLYEYYRGKQPVFYRTKKVRDDIVNRVVENRANEIVSFKVAYTIGKPVQYVTNSAEDLITDSAMRLSDLLNSVNKNAEDKKLVEWDMICGTAYRFVSSSEDEDIIITTLNPMNSFVVYNSGVGEKPICGVSYSEDKYKNKTFSVYTKDMYYEVAGDVIVDSKPIDLGGIPIIEYPANSARLGAFETVIGLLDAVNEFDSNRLDAVEQFVQSLLVIYNANIKDGLSARDVCEKGLIVLKSFEGLPADIKILAEQLDQTQNQTLKDDLMSAIRHICGLPSQSDGNTSDSSNNGAVIVKNGWWAAESRAEDYEGNFKASEREAIKIMLHICNNLNLGVHLVPSDIDVKFTRRNYEDISTKSDVLIKLLSNDKVHPLTAYTFCNGFTDAESEYKMGMEWYEKNLERTNQTQESEKT